MWNIDNRAQLTGRELGLPQLPTYCYKIDPWTDLIYNLLCLPVCLFVCSVWVFAIGCIPSLYRVQHKHRVN